MHTIPEAEYKLLIIARDRLRDGRATEVIAHEVVWCEDGLSAMVYLYFGAPGDDPREADVSDIVGCYYDFPTPVAEADFDCVGAVRHFEAVVQSIIRVWPFACTEVSLCRAADAHRRGARSLGRRHDGWRRPFSVAPRCLESDSAVSREPAADPCRHAAAAPTE
jgi:hypothetical protein